MSVAHALARTALALCCGAHGAAAGAAEYYDRYDLSPDPTHVDLGVQPNAYPIAFISAVMQRDRILKHALAATGVTLRTFPFAKGNDMVGLMGGGKLEGALLGDMPTINAAMRTPLAIVGLAKRNFSSVVSHRHSRMEQLRGKRVGYSAGSSSHYVLLLGLKTAGMTERDLQLVQLEPTRMSDALEDGSVEAFAAWEPTPTIAIARNPRNRHIYRAISTDWIVLSRDYTRQRPGESLLVTAAYVRAIHWMKADGRHAEQAARWTLAERRAFQPDAAQMTVAQAVANLRSDLLDVPGLPGIPAAIGGAPPLTGEYAFLRSLGMVSVPDGESRLREALDWGGLREVHANPKRFQLMAYDYDVASR